MYYLISILLGLVPEVLFFTLLITNIKNIKEKRLKLFMLISIVYFLCMLIQRFVILYYVAFIFLCYFVFKIVYKNKIQIIDLFVFTCCYSYVCLLAIIMYFFVNNNLTLYYILYCIDRLLLLVPFLFIKQLRKLYNNYCKLWNRNDKEKRPIKSITLRNISLIVINIFIFILNIATISCFTLFK